MVKPGGTGRPMRHISARFAPLPPTRGFMPPLPSVFVLPNKYTYFPLGLEAWVFGLEAWVLGLAFFAVFFFAITVSVVFLSRCDHDHDVGLSGLPRLLRNKLR